MGLVGPSLSSPNHTSPYKFSLINIVYVECLMSQGLVWCAHCVGMWLCYGGLCTYMYLSQYCVCYLIFAGDMVVHVFMYLTQCSVCYVIFAGISIVVHVCMYLTQCSVHYVIFAGNMVVHVCMYLTQCSVCYVIFAGNMVVHVCMYLTQCSVCYVIFAGISIVVHVHILYNPICVLHNTIVVYLSMCIRT